jgi:hypothetical protein
LSQRSAVDCNAAERIALMCTRRRLQSRTCSTASMRCVARNSKRERCGSRQTHGSSAVAHLSCTMRDIPRCMLRTRASKAGSVQMGRTRPHLGALLRRVCVQERRAIWLGYAATSAPGPRAPRPALPTRPAHRWAFAAPSQRSTTRCNHVPVARQASVGSSDVVLCCADRCSAAAAACA